MGITVSARAGGRIGGRRARLPLAVAGAVALLGGCTMVGPDYETPQAEVNPEWVVEQAGDGSAPAAGADESWWDTFSDPTLTALVRGAYAQNLTLRVAGLRVIQARARRGIAAGLFFPQVQSLTGGVSHSHESDNGPFAVEDQTYSTAQVGIDAAWELDFWGKFRRGIESADAGVLAAVADYDAVLVSLVADVASSYIRIRALEEQVAYARANVELQKDTLALTQARFKAGAVSELDVATSKATLANTQALIPRFEEDLQQTKLSLCVLLGRTPSQLDAELAPAPGAARRVPDAPVRIAAGIPADLLRRRPDVRSYERLAAAQSARIGAAKADLYPSISITGTTGFMAASVDGSHHRNMGDFADYDSFQGFVGLSVNWPVLNYGRIENNIRVEDALYEEAVATYRQSVLQAASEVEAGLSTFLHARQAYGFLGDAVTASQRSVELSLIQYRSGASDFIRVNQAQGELVDQQIQLAATQAAVALGVVRTFRALGGGWHLRGDEEFVDAETAERMRQRTNWGDVLNPDWKQGKDVGFPRSQPQSPDATAEPAPAK